MLPGNNAVNFVPYPQLPKADPVLQAALDDLCHLATTVCEASGAIVSLLEGKQYKIKAAYGITKHWPETTTTVEQNLCLQSLPPAPRLVIGETIQDQPRSLASRGRSQTSLHCCESVSLMDAKGLALGVLSVFDTTPRDLTSVQRASLKSLGRQIIDQLELSKCRFERRRIEQVLRDSEQQFQSVVDTVKEVFFEINQLGCWTLLNAAWTRMTGFSLGESIGTPFLDYIHPDDRPQQAVLFQTLLEKQLPYQQEVRCLMKDGNWCWVTMSAHVGSKSESGILSISGTLENISHQKQTELILQENQSHFQKVVAQIPGALFQVLQQRDGTTQALFISSGCCELCELGPVEIAQDLNRVVALIHPSDRHDWLELTTEAIRHLQPWRWEGRIITPSGQLKWVQGTCRPEIQANGDVLWQGFLTDITDRKQAESLIAERSRLSALAAEISLTLGESRTLADVLERCTNTMVENLQAASVRIWTLDQETGLLELQATAGQHFPVEDFPNRVPLGISMLGFIGQTMKPYTSNQVTQEVCLISRNCLKREGIVSLAGYPLIVEDRLVGVIAIFSNRLLGQMVHDLLNWIAISLAIAIDRSWARQALLSRRESLLLRLGNQIRQSLDLDTILQTTVSEIRNLLHIDRCYFFWCWPIGEQLSIAVTHEAREAELPSLLGELPAAQAAPLSESILNLEVLWIDHVEDEPDLNPTLRSQLQELGIVSQLLLPLETRSGQFGALICSHSLPRAWSHSEVDLLRAVVDQLAIAMDQAELYAQTRAAALAAQTQAQQLSETLHKLQETQSQLVQHEKMSSLGQMVAGVAHEINNPVNFIAGNVVHARKYAQELLNLLHLYEQHYPEPDEEIQEMTEDIDLEFLEEDLVKVLSSMQMGADRIRQIVLSLRNFSRLDEAEMKPVNIHEGIDSTLLILQNRLKAHDNRPGIQIVKEYGELPAVECYAGQLNQVFMNVLVNAIDALDEFISKQIEQKEAGAPSAPFSPMITIHTETLENDVLIQIRDNGPGMPETVRKKLFDPFFTTKPVGKGTGLGLSISYQIVAEKHGGRLECISAPGQGSEFQIQIPIMPPSRANLAHS